MRTLFVFLTVIGMLAAGGCRKNNLSWRMEFARLLPSVPDSDYVEIFYPVAEGGEAADSINKQIIGVLKSHFTPDGMDGTSMTLVQIADSIIVRKNRDTALLHLPYTLIINGKILSCGKVASVRLNTYRMTGGAHGEPKDFFLNFDMRDGRLLTLSDLISDTMRFWEINRAAFSKFLFDSGFNATALFVDQDSVPLRQNIGIDSSGISMHYNPYDIAPYAFGVTDYTIPYDQIEPILKRVARK